MIRTLRAAALVLMLLSPPLAVLRAAESDAPPPDPTWYAQAFAHSDGGLNVTHFWSKGPKLRAETVVAGHRVVTIVSGDTYYAYDAVRQLGVAIGRSPTAIAKDDRDRRPFGRELETMLGQGAEFVREDRHLGALCKVYRVTDDRGKRELWMTKGAHELPVRLSLYSRSSGATTYTDYLNWLSGLAIPEGFFEPEPRVELVRLSFQEYLDAMAEHGAVGPVPVLYADLLHGGR